MTVFRYFPPASLLHLDFSLQDIDIIFIKIIIKNIPGVRFWHFDVWFGNGFRQSYSFHVGRVVSNVESLVLKYVCLGFLGMHNAHLGY